MNKISDLLNYHKKTGADRKEDTEDLSDRAEHRNFDSETREKLARTYIFNPASASRHVIKKQEREISPSTYNPDLSDARSTQIFPWLISFLAILLLLVNIVYRGKININIEVMRDGAAPAISEASRQPAQTSVLAPVTTPLIVEGQLNNYVIKQIGFYGAATNRSRILPDGLHLVNDGSTSWASAGIDLAKPMDLSDTTLDFFIKGNGGRESLKLILRDSENNSYMPQAYNIIFDKNMSSNWQFISVPFKKFTGTFNSKKINHIGFEFGTGTTLNDPGASIYVKNIKIVENNPDPR